jgi:RNA polymerase sigma-70 factor, ECF subfamily
LDIVQNVFTAVWEKNKYKLPEAHLKSYLFNATRNACINYLKHALVMRKFDEETSYALKELEIDYYESGEKSLIQKESVDEIYKVINSLSVKNREILVLSRFERLKNQEIANRLGIPVRTVETRLFRALKSLRTKLSDKNIQILFSFFQKKTL